LDKIQEVFQHVMDGLLEFATSQRYGTLVAIVITVLGIALVAANASLPGTYITLMLNDHFHFLDGAYRVHLGQIPHLDFQAPIGMLTYLLPSLALDWGLPLGRAMPMATALTTAFLLPATVYICMTRLRPAMALVVGVFSLMLVASPIILGQEPFMIGTAMSYNRFCWVAFALMLLVYLPPHRDGWGFRIGDGIVLGMLMIFHFYVKITYAILAALVIALVCFARRGGWAIFAISAVMTGAAIGSVETIWPGLVHAYIDNIRFALGVDAGFIHKIPNFGKKLINSLPELLLAISVVGAGFYLSVVRRFDLLFLLFAIACSAVIIQQNGQIQDLPALVAIVAITAELSARANAKAAASTPIDDGSRFRRASYYWFFVSALILIAQPVVFSTYAMGQQLYRVHQHDPDANPLPVALKGHVVHDHELSRLFVVRPDVRPRPIDYDYLRLLRAPRQRLFETEYVETIADGAALLRAEGLDRCPILTLDMINLFPIVLGNEPQKGLPLSNQINRTFSFSVFVPLEEWFAKDPIVMIPKRPVTGLTKDAFLKLFAARLWEGYEVAAENDFWTVLAPKGRADGKEPACEDVRVGAGSN
jgi:hypothetical protein